MHRKVQLATIYLERDDNLVFFTHSKVITIIIMKFLTPSDSKTKNNKLPIWHTSHHNIQAHMKMHLLHPLNSSHCCC